MKFAIASGIESALSAFGTATTVLDAAIERACDAGGVKPESAEGFMMQQEIAYIRELMTGVYTLLQGPIEELEDIKGKAYQVAREEKEAAA